MKKFYLGLLACCCSVAAFAQTTTTFSYTGSLQTYTVPSGITSITIAASGAQGGNETNGGYIGGKGANMSGTFTVTPGHVLDIMVGQQPATNSYTGGGGGGTFVWDVTAGNVLLIAAGGGGGAGYGASYPNGADASTSNNGTPDASGSYGGYGTGGYGASGSTGSVYAAGGAGWLSNGNNTNYTGCSYSATGGQTPLSGGAGGNWGGTSGSNGPGGYGGGGGSQGYCSWLGGGGGGGYSGGAPGEGIANGGGGGGSYNIGTSQSNSVGNTGNGSVTITALAPSTCSGTPTAGSVVATPSTGGSSTSFTLSLSGSTYTSAYTYQWQSSSTGSAGSWTNISGATGNTYTFTGITSNTYYQCVVTCTTSGLSSTATSTEIFVSGCTPSSTSWIGYGGGTTTFNYTGSLQTYTVPSGVTGVIIAASGAQGGGSSTYSGGKGANMSGTFSVIPGHVLDVMVGQQGYTASNAGGGGGGSFVWDVTAGNVLLIAAGGGGGGGYSSSLGAGVDADTLNNGKPGLGGYNGGGVSGNGGTEPTSFAGYSYWACGGAGWLSNGNAGYSGAGCPCTGGYTPLSGGAGGAASNTNVGAGGYGGGGGAEARCGIVGGGGGGGYSGGGPGCDNSSYYNPGGGGGSYNIGTSQSNSIGHTGNGVVTITTSSLTGYGVRTFYVTPATGSALYDTAIATSASSATGYLSRVSSIAPVTLYQGGTYASSITWQTVASYQEAQVWIDFNNDGTFQTSEEVSPVSGYSTTSTPSPTTFNISIPSTATIGNHLMRMRGIYEYGTYGYALSSHLDPCLAQYLSTVPEYQAGDVVDYQVNIAIPPAPCSGTPTAGTVTASPLIGGSTTSFLVTLTGTTFASGLTFQWQSATSSSGPWSSISGATNTSYGFTGITSDKYFQCVVTCTVSGLSSTSSNTEILYDACTPTSASWNEGSLSGTNTYTYTGTVQTWTVPTGVTSITVDMQGAKGGNASTGSAGGAGGRVQATLAVTPGSTLNIYVGGAGSNSSYTYTYSVGGSSTGVGGTGGYYCGGGGGASDIRIGGTALSNRVLVAGGGGGAGYNCGSSSEAGGAGGGLTGGTGEECTTYSTSLCGQGGSQTAGGLGATSYYTSPTGQGSLGVGANGSYSYYYSGAGGGGYYGGGAGAYGGGGGGSSYNDPVLATSVTHTQGYNSTGNGSVTITYSGVFNDTPSYGINTFGITPGTGTALVDTGICAAAGITTGFANRTSIAPVTLYQGIAHPAYATWGIATSYQEGQVWIDFNNDGTFQTSEEVTPVFGYNTTTTPNPVYFNITIPSTAPTGNHLMRIRGIHELSSYGYGLSTDLDPCLIQYLSSAPQYADGDVADYIVNIATPPSCSGSPTIGAASAVPGVGTSTTPIVLSLPGYTLAGGLSYQWQSAAASTGPWTNISGATAPSYSFTGISATTFYQCVITCSYSGLSSTSTTTQVLIEACTPTGAAWAEGSISGLTTYSYTGSVQTWTVPTGVTSINVDMQGAKGGSGLSGTGGAGGRVQATIPVTSGSSLNIYVGGVGSSYSYSYTTPTGGTMVGGTGGYYAAGGGGASDIRIGGTALSNRVLVAGGGGGGAYWCGYSDNGGNGGGLSGVAGYECGSFNTSYCGQGGTQTAGGAGATFGGSAGSLGVGGNSGYYYYGGAGGGGYYGGGGGYYGGGGGGSSYAESTATSLTMTAGYNSIGNGSVTISYSTSYLDTPIYGINTFGVTPGTGTALTDTGICAAANITTGYVNRTTAIAPITLYQGISHPASITWGLATSYQEAQVWIDFNNDGTFQTSEEVTPVVGYNATTTPNPVNFSLNIPSTAPIGSHLMRIRGILEDPSYTYGLSSHLDPCLVQYLSTTPNYKEGDIVDYIVNISAPPACTGSPTVGAAAAVPGVGTSTTPILLSLPSYPFTGGTTYQWQSAAASTGPWTNISGATATTYSFTGITASTYYQCIITCTYSGLSSTSTTTQVLLQACTPTGAAWAEGSISGLTTYSYTGAVQTWTIPAGVTTINVDMQGATGGSGLSGSGGAGGRVQAVIPVTPGSSLNIYVGGVGANYSYSGSAATGGSTVGGSAGYYAAGGGGASDIRIGGTALSNRVLVAGGGGGGAYWCGYSDNGGNGGGLSGLAGQECGTYNTSYCGQGGTQTAGGAGATFGGLTGTLGIGGNSGYYYYGGAGGGGYYGGGGGYYGGGGGGSSYADPSATSLTMTSGYNTSGNGSITLSYSTTYIDTPIYGVNTFGVTPGTGSALTDAGICAAANTITGYVNRTSSIAPITLYQGISHPASITWGLATSYQEAQVWIDFNNDGTFQTTEEVSPVTGYSTSSTPNPTFFNINIPSTAPTGDHIMRIRGIIEDPSYTYGYSSDLDPCLIQYLSSTPKYKEGDIVDYIVNIATPPACSGTPTTGIASITPTVGSSTTPFLLSLPGYTLAGGLSYQWQSSSSSSGPWTNISGATSASFAFTGISASTYYQCIITCSSSGLSSISTSTVALINGCSPSGSAWYEGTSTGTTTYTYTGIAQTWTIPAGVTSLIVDMQGAKGGNSSVGALGGAGGRTQATLPVTPGSIVNIYVGGKGANSAGFGTATGGSMLGGTGGSYAGGGGGASDIRIGGTALSNRKLVAAGGGGAGYNCASTSEIGGYGGGSTGGTGYECGTSSTYYCGGGATTSSGGTGATGYGAPTGTLGNGGNGIYAYSGGGGGGYYGGGGAAYGGGGGGSSYTDPSATSVTLTSGYNTTGNGAVTISYSGIFADTTLYGINTFSVTPGTGAALSDAGICAAANNITGYLNRTTTIAPVTLYQAGTYNSTITWGIATSYQEAQVWIDFNNDGNFQTTEEVSPVVGYSTSSTVSPLTFNISIPSGAATGSHLMRIRGIVENGTYGYGLSSDLDPCLIQYLSTTPEYKDGDIVDYLVNIIPNTCSGTPLAGTLSATTTSGCATYTSTITASGVTAGIGISYQWQKSLDSLSWSNVSGATSTSYSASISTTTYYRLFTTCSSSGLSDSSAGIKLNVNPIPTSITGSSPLCVGSTASFTDATSGGTWSSSATTIATVSVTGVVSGAGQGTAIITYSTGCGTAATYLITVYAVPSAITGLSSVCTGSTITLTETATGGTWSSASLGTATIGTTGILSGVATGSTTISYTNGCGTGVAYPITVNTAPSAITGGSTVCTSGTLSLTEAMPGGTWSSGITTLATVDPVLGIVYGVATGIDTIINTNSCGFVKYPVTVNTTPVAITGTGIACSGSTTTLTETVTGGTWSSSSISIATVGSTGIVTGTGSGIATITYSNGCGTAATYPVTVSGTLTAIYGPSVVCSGSSITDIDTTFAGTWSSSATTIASVTSTGIVTGGIAGVATISYTTTCGSVTYPVTVNINPIAITGASSVCIGDSIALTETATGGTWSCSTTGTATVSALGYVYGVTSGTATISYANGCGVAATTNITVNTVPAAISGSSIVCTGSNISLSDAIAGGTWSSGTTTLATVDPVLGVVGGLSAGIDTIKYTNSCGVVQVPITVNAIPSTITGGPIVCTGDTIYLSETATGGSWSSTASTIATINTSGRVIGLVNGTATISYSNGCGTGVALPITVNLSPSPITGATVVCVGTTVTYTDLISIGTWNSSNTTIASVDGSGTVYGISSGVATISFSNTCGSSTKVVTVVTSPSAIAGTAALCLGTSSTLTNTIPGGSWTTLDSATAYINSSTGIVIGNTVDTTTIIYSIPGCGYSSQIVTVNTTPAPIVGNAAICIGNTLSLIDTVSSGLWSSTATSIATVNVATGVVTGVSGGTATISYTNYCGFATAIVTVNAPPAAIGGPTNVCYGDSITVTDVVTTGVWSSSNTSIASINAITGKVHGLNAGIDTIINTNTCGTVIQSITVNVAPVAIVGSTDLCVGSNITLTDSIIGGTWTSGSTSIGTISTTGVMHGVATGVVVITYSNVCGSSYHTVTVNTASPTAITGPTIVCTGSTITLNDAISGGTWTSSNTTSATINAISGVVSGLTVGTSNIAYSTGCGVVSYFVTVIASPSPITGASWICSGSTTTLNDLTIGGIWNSSSTTIATIGAANGIVHGLTAGIVTLTYTSCGVAATTTLNVISTPGTITGTTTFCVGTTDTLHNTVTGGTWTSSDTTVATVDSVHGIISGLTAGTSIISYSNSCGSSIPVTITVKGLPTTITSTSGLSAMCSGSGITLSDAIAGGTWSSSITTIATINSSTGIVNGISQGTAIMSYSSCGSSATFPVTVYIAPTTIGGVSNICAGDSITLTDASFGGNWTSSNTTIANVNIASGKVTGISSGTATITYQVGSCGASVTAIVTVLASPAIIGGRDSLCASGGTDSLYDISGGGTWSIDTSLATISTTGMVTGVSAGIVHISYHNTCGTGTKTVTVNPLPSAILGSSTVCAGGSTNWTGVTSGGHWSTTSSILSIVSTTGTITGHPITTASTDSSAIITYTLPTGCSLARSITVNPLPNAGTITGTTDSICIGATATYIDTVAIPSGTSSSWSMKNTKASISGGIVTGLLSGRDTIIYTLHNSCGNEQTFKNVYIKPLADTGHITTPILGYDSICVGTTLTLHESVTGGIWKSGDTSKAHVSTSGVVTGIASGTVPISYITTNSCGANADYKNVHIHGKIAVLPITGPTFVCPGAPIALHDSTSGGVWSAKNTHAIISPSGVVTAVVTGSTDSIIYVVHNTCGNDTVGKMITINALPYPGSVYTSTGFDTVCANNGSLLMMDSTSSGAGIWSVTDTSLAIINDTTGLVRGRLAGLDTVIYSVFNICGTRRDTVILDVKPLEYVASIAGLNTVCVNAADTLADSVLGGYWAVSDTLLNSISSEGIVTGIMAGTDTVRYTVNNGCGNVTTYFPITINPLANAGTISGNSLVCINGTSYTYTDTTSSGIWALSDSVNANIAGSNVAGEIAGMDTVYYMVTNICNTDTAKMPIIIANPPIVSPITGNLNICQGVSETLIDTTIGGSWTSSNHLVATIDSNTGVLSAIASTSNNMDTVWYTISNSCGTAAARATINVQTLPSNIILSGAPFICQGSRDFADTLNVSPYIGGGTWSVSNGNAVVSTNGIVTPTASGSGIDTIYYSVTNACGTRTATKSINIYSVWQCDSATSVKSVNTNYELIKVYPNPSYGEVTIELPTAGMDYIINIMDIYGRILDSRSVAGSTSNKELFNLSKLSSGSYLIKVTIDGNTYVQKIEKF